MAAAARDSLPRVRLESGDRDRRLSSTEQHDGCSACGSCMYGPGRDRTCDLGIKSPLLYQLSYRPPLLGAASLGAASLGAAVECTFPRLQQLFDVPALRLVEVEPLDEAARLGGVVVLDRRRLLGLRLGRHIDGFVDAYDGPPELAERANGEEPVAPAELAEEAAALAAEVAFDDEHRNRWLRAQLAGCEVTARRLAGEPIGWADEVERCYGVRPRQVPEERFAAAQEQLEKALSGRGDLGERYRTWLGTQVVDPGLVERAAAVFADDLRERTRERFGLPDGETVSFESVQNEPWSGFNYYLGNRHSRVVVNTDLPIHSLDLPDLVAHEMYPVHHTEHAWKEALLVDGEGRLEESLFLTGTPQAIVSEGIATMARETIYGEDGEEIAAQTLAGLGIPAEADTARA